MMLTLLAAVALQIDLGGKPAKAEIKILAVRTEKKDVRAGDVFKVSFDLEIPKDWHIYPAYPTSTGTPTKLVSDLLEVAGPYEEPPAKTKPKSEFLDAYDYHEGAITIAVPVRLKGDVKPGPLEATGLLDYQICKSVCLAGKTKFSFALDVQEAKKRRAPPAEIKILSVKPARTEVKAGETFNVAFELEIPKDWHIYPTTPTTTGTPTKVVSEAAEVTGPYAEPKPKLKPKSEFLDAYEYHEGTITIVAPLRLKPGVKPGPFEVKGVLDYQICDPNRCVGVKTDFSFPITVLEGQAAAAPVSAGGGASGTAGKELDARGLLGFLLFAMGGGALSLVMPCVYPLIPITLTYFIKQGAGSRSKSVALSTAYAAGIVLVFTAIGFIFSLTLGAGGAQIFASNPWVNIGVGGLFLWFTFSLFGLYEITLPSWLVGGVTGQRRSGIGGAFILGALFSVVTFTCTVPIAATVLALTADKGAASKFSGLFAMLAYSATMAGPFFILGLFPGLLKEVPKSGGWLHTVKVTAAFAELALAFYYFSKADFVWDVGVLTRDVMTGVWIAALVFMALYLLKVFRIKGDDEEPAAHPPVGVFRMLWALVFTLVAVQFSSLYAGRVPGVLALVLPPAPFGQETAAGGSKGDSQPVFPTLGAALEEAKKAGKPVFVEFTGAT
jgi:cytochrome c biogenesis protein CcdA/DsbC/DsbD-like thiol-disulfide interchange protein